MATISERLREILSIRNMKQAEIVEKTGITRGAVSSYLSGRYLPKQDSIYKMAKVLNVNPAWLMGLDVPMDNPTPLDTLPFPPEYVAKALELYGRYENLTLENQIAFQTLLKNLQSDV